MADWLLHPRRRPVADALVLVWVLVWAFAGYTAEGVEAFLFDRGGQGVELRAFEVAPARLASGPATFVKPAIACTPALTLDLRVLFVVPLLSADARSDTRIVTTSST